MVEQILILDEHTTDAGIAYLSEGLGAPSMVLIVSWATIEHVHQGMNRIMQCGAWQIDGQDHTLTIIGRGSVVALPDGEASVIFLSQWTMDDPYVVSFFVQQARTHGYFLLLPAVNKMPSAGPPVPCYLM